MSCAEKKMRMKIPEYVKKAIILSARHHEIAGKNSKLAKFMKGSGECEK